MDTVQMVHGAALALAVWFTTYGSNRVWLMVKGIVS